MHSVPPMTSKRVIYLDYNATTPCDKEVLEEMLPYFNLAFGNPSSPNAHGSIAASTVAKAREFVAQAIGAKASSVIFTSGGTESNNIALLGVQHTASSRKRVLISAVEHKSVIVAARKLSESGCDVKLLPVDSDGVVDIKTAEKLINSNTLLVSVQAANNETGVEQPIKELSELSHKKGALFHCDAVQLLGKRTLNVSRLGVDLASFSAHKLYGPKGIGALYIANSDIRNRIVPLFGGGGQEDGLRPGTLNVPAIAGFGKACELAANNLYSRTRHIEMLQKNFEKKFLQHIAGATINSQNSTRIPGTISITIPGIPADMLMANTPNLSYSNGAACNSGALDPSHVLIAMGLSRDNSESTVRLSFGCPTTAKDADNAYLALARAISMLRKKLQPD